MPTYETKVFVDAITKKGCQEDKKHNKHHIFYWYYIDGNKTAVRTWISKGEKDFDDYLFGCRSQQLHLSKENLLRLIDCAMSAQAYRDYLLDRGHVRLPQPPPAPIKKNKQKPNKKKGRRK